MIIRIKSIDLYLDYPAKTVVEADELEDVGCGIYPCFYLRNNGKLYLSTSVVSLIRYTNSFKRDAKFKPPDFYNKPPEIIRKQKLSGFFKNLHEKNCFERKTKNVLFFILRYLRDRHQFDLLSRWFTEEVVKQPSWYDSYRTVDQRIRKLKAFELVTFRSNQISFNPGFKSIPIPEIIEKSAFYIREFINSVEKKFPGYHHVVLTAGKDSQIIWLAPKLFPANWSLFSAHPNFPLVRKWLSLNNIEPAFCFEHTNLNDESIEDLKKKIIAGDLFSDPRHIRWMPEMVKIAEQFDQKCIFWGGTAADAIFKYYPDFHKSAKNFFRTHMTRVAHFQGNYHQTFRNFTGLPYLSPYHSEMIWKELFLRIDPMFILDGNDIRKELGEVLAGRKINWIDENPSPPPYCYHYDLNPENLYLNHIHSIFNG